MTDPELFLVRIWRQLAGGFHASVRRVDGEETRHFSKPDEVTQFLCDTAAQGQSPSPDATTASETQPSTRSAGDAQR
jgi:hypothetical protein